MEWYIYSESLSSDGSKTITNRPKDVIFEEDEDTVEVVFKIIKVPEAVKVNDKFSDDGKQLYNFKMKIETKYLVVNGKDFKEYPSEEEAFAAAEELLKR